MKIGDRVIVARHIRCGNGYIFDEMIGANGKIVDIKEDRAYVEFGCLGVGGKQSTIVFSYQLDQLDLFEEDDD